MLFNATDIIARRIVLRLYRFECDCIACTNKWPVYEELFDDLSLPRSFGIVPLDSIDNDSPQDEEFLEDMFQRCIQCMEASEENPPRKSYFFAKTIIRSIILRQANRDLEL